MVQRNVCESNAPLNGSSSSSSQSQSHSQSDGGPSTAIFADFSERINREKGSAQRGTGKFSLFKWLRSAKSRDTAARRIGKSQDEPDKRLSTASSTESDGTFYSTTTVRSFAFHSGTLGSYNRAPFDILRQAAEVGPFAAGASKFPNDKENEGTEAASTLPAHSCRKDITARYSLQPCVSFNSCGNLPTPRRNLSGSLKRLDDQARHSSSAGGGGETRKRVHVKGKRRAPKPPDVHIDSEKVSQLDARNTARSSNRRKRRPAPKPPEKSVASACTKEENVKIADERGMDVEGTNTKDIEQQCISTDTLVLQGGVLLPKKEPNKSPKPLSRSVNDAENTPKVSLELLPTQEATIQPNSFGTLNSAMPRPWYKRSVFEHRDSGPSRRGDFLRGPALPTLEIKDESCTSGTMSSSNHSMDNSTSRLSFFHRGEKQSEERKREAKRRSGLSILTNISELDKEAAAIVQEEQARARASLLLKTARLADTIESKNDDGNEEIVQDIVTSAIESPSPRRGTRALISKFNAISNITKVTVNTNFFARNNRDSNSRLDRDRSSRVENLDDWPAQPRFSQRHSGHVVQMDKDISRYFLPQQRIPKNKHETNVEPKPQDSKHVIRKEQNDRLTSETTNRISFLQSQLAANRAQDSPLCVVESADPITREKVTSGFDKNDQKDHKRLKSENETTGPRAVFSARMNDKVGERESIHDVERLENIHKEFSDIFNEINGRIKAREFKDNDRLIDTSRNIVQLAEDVSGTTNRVTKVLDILVEAEKTRVPIPNKKSEADKLNIPEETVQVEVNVKPAKIKSTALNTVEDPITMDLKEMLKEMKHSLPKRGKPKKTAASKDVAEDLNGKIETASNSNPLRFGATKTEVVVIQNDYEMEKQKVSSSAQTSGNIRRLIQPTNRALKLLNEPSTSTRDQSPMLKQSTDISNEPSTSFQVPVSSTHFLASSSKPSTSSSSSSSGPVRSPATQSSSSTTSPFVEWKQEGVSYKTSGKNAGFVKNTFQLIRPRDFAEIEATKTTKPTTENTYANVMEQSLYANAHVPAQTPKSRENAELVKKSVPEEKEELKETKVRDSVKKAAAETEEDFLEEEEDEGKSRNMNTLAVNRLLRKLEAAISSGHHQQAAGLAKELARLKIHCSVVRQRSERLKERLIKVNMYIEDKLAHQGPIPLQLPTKMTVAELKRKVQAEFEIPANVQRWIIGKNLADRDEASIEELRAVDGSPIFLYLVAPELQKENIVLPDKPTVDEQPPKVIDENSVVIVQNTKENNEKEEVELVAEAKEDERKTPDEVKMERYEELISLENCDVIPNSEPIECPVCFVTYGPREGVILRDCLHMFCRPCLANTILYCEEAEVKCPYRDTEYTCESTLQEREIKALVEPAVYQQHLAKSITQAENNAGNNAFHCKTPDCPGWCIYDDDVNNFLCPVCNVNNCLTCQAQHTGKNCRQYQEELRYSKETDQESRRTAEMLEEMVERGEALPCPTCAVVLMKKWGCDWLRCSMCKTEICWVTKGPRWGPGGKGDTSGGCRCGENGVKCHPRCNYCH